MSYNSNTVLSSADSLVLNLYRLSKISSDRIFAIKVELRHIFYRIPEYYHNEEEQRIDRRNPIRYHERQSLESSRRSWRRSVWTLVLILGFLLLETDLLLEFRILDDLVQSRSNLHVQHLKSEIFFPITVREDFNSSNESTVSTSLIHNIASGGNWEQVVTWFLNRIFQSKNDWGSGNLLNCCSEICCLCCPTKEFCGNSTGTSCKCRHWNCVSTLVVIWVPDPVACGTDPRSLCGAQGWIPWWWSRRDPLYRVMTFSQFLCGDFVNSLLLSSLHFSHFVHASDLCISENNFHN